MVDILHQIVFKGTLKLPPAAATRVGSTTLKAVLAFRGVGNACFWTDSIQRWHISSELERGWLTGGGPVQVKGGPGT
jgi:hypothetical protein